MDREACPSLLAPGACIRSRDADGLRQVHTILAGQQHDSDSVRLLAGRDHSASKTSLTGLGTMSPSLRLFVRVRLGLALGSHWQVGSRQ